MRKENSENRIGTSLLRKKQFWNAPSYQAYPILNFKHRQKPEDSPIKDNVCLSARRYKARSAVFYLH